MLLKEPVAGRNKLIAREDDKHKIVFNSDPCQVMDSLTGEPPIMQVFK
jgi:hypothetical protein